MKGDKEEAAAAEKLITQNKVVALAGAFCSSATKSVQPISEKYGVSFVNGISADPSLTNPVRPWFFRTKIHNGMRAVYYSKFIGEALHLIDVAADQLSGNPLGGTIADMHLDGSSHDVAIDKSCWGSITREGQFPPLPRLFHASAWSGLMARALS